MAKSSGCTLKLTFIILGVIVALVTVAVVGLGTILATNKDSLHRVAVELLASNVFPSGAGEANYRALCLIALDENTNSIGFRCRVPPGLSGMTALHVRGPVSRNSATWSGDLAGVLCGATLVGPSTSCVNAPLGEFSGSVQMEISNNAAVVDVRPLLHEIRKNPDLFYLELLTHAKPTSPGALRGSLSNFAGWQ
jgi:hypothetical protein